MLLVGFFLGRFAGQGALNISAGTLAPRWFVSLRGRAIMLVGLGATASSMLFPVLNNLLVQSYGWRSSFRILAGGLWFVYVPLALYLIVSHPEKIGMQPFRRAIEHEDADVSVLSRDEVSLTRAEAIRTPAFWIVSLVFFQFALVSTGIGLHFISIFSQRGYDAAFAARVMSVKPGLGLGATIFLGLAIDRIKRPQFILAILSALQCLGYLLLIILAGSILPYVYTIVAGLSGSTSVYMIRFMSPFLFGRKHIGSISGIMSVIILAGSALGPLPYGAAYDFFGGYTEILLISALMPAVAAVASALIRRPSASLAR
jgi:cyanate permease